MLRHVAPWAALAFVAVLPAHAASQDATRFIELEVRDGPAGRTGEPVRIAIPVPTESASTVETRIGPARYRVIVRRERGDRADSPLHFDIHRVDRRGDGTRDVALSVSVRLASGRRATLARFDRPDGTRTELTARVVASPSRR